MASDIINKAVEYIIAHNVETITIDDIANHCHVSKYYFCHLFKEQTGESVYSFIKRRKLEQSASRLWVEQDRPITDIALDYGYSSSNFSTAFKQMFDQSPVDFRMHVKKTVYMEEMQDYYGNLSEEQLLEIVKEVDNHVTIKELPEYIVMYERKISKYEDLKQTWCQFMEDNKEYSTENTIYFERTYDDPEITDKNRCMFDVGMNIDKETMEQHPEKNITIFPAGRYVVYHFQGPLENITPVHSNLMYVWFPYYHYQLGLHFGYDRYLHGCDDLNHMDFEICIPIK